MNDSTILAQLELIKKALEYYADPANYVNGQIQKDQGHIAKHTLGLIKDTKGQFDAAQELYMKTQATMITSDNDADLAVDSLQKLEQINELLKKHKN